MKKTFIILLFPLLFLFCGASLENYTYSSGSGFLPIELSIWKTNNKKFFKEVKDDNRNLHKDFNIEEGKTLDLNINCGGSLSIEGWNKNVVSADVEASRDNIDDYEIEFNKTNDGIKVESDTKHESSNNGGLHFVFMVPSKFNLKIHFKGGGIEIKNVNGTINGQTMGGPLDLSNLKGNLDLETMGGPIKLYDSEVDGKIHTMGGPVEITNVKGNIKGTTNGGPVILKNVTSKSGSSTGNAITVSSMGGSINLDEAPSGADLKTMGGSIDVKSAKKFVKAETMGGSIEY